MIRELMNTFRAIGLIISITSAILLSSARAQAPAGPQGPFPPDQWPASIDPSKTVHFVSVDDAFAPPGDTWITGNMQILSGADQVTTPVTIGGFNGLKATASYINVADNDFTEWADDDNIDILMQVYGDAAVLSAKGESRDFNFLIG